jgi:hypothetical protein
MALFITTAVKTSNPTSNVCIWYRKLMFQRQEYDKKYGKMIF